ncbi:hypothetical protein [Helicobacter suis]|uniref:hypothetical protein n=1 Tax=Helicobacter suis TaxID=104628 RepID=UPI0013D2F73B|nr:hypothetical protein [Helicobacter suis]
MAEKYSKEWIKQYNKEVEAYNQNHRALEAKAMRFGVSLEEAKNIHWWDGAWWDGGVYLCKGDW